MSTVVGRIKSEAEEKETIETKSLVPKPSHIPKHSQRFKIVNDDDTLLETMGYAVDSSIEPVDAKEIYGILQDPVIIDEKWGAEIPSQCPNDSSVTALAVFSIEHNEFFVLHKHKIFASQVVRNESVFQFKVLTEDLSGQKVILHFNIDFEKYCSFLRLGAKKTERYYKMITKYLHAGYVGPSFQTFDNIESFNKLCEDLLSGWNTYLKDFPKEKIDVLETLRQKLVVLNQSFPNLQTTAQEGFKQKQQVINEIFDIIKKERGHLLRAEFLNNFLISEKFKSNWASCSHAMVYYIKIIGRIGTYLTTWIPPIQYNDGAIQLLDYLAACNPGGNTMFHAFAQHIFRTSDIILITQYAENKTIIPTFIISKKDNNQPTIVQANILESNWNRLTLTADEIKFMHYYLRNRWGLQQKTPMLIIKTSQKFSGIYTEIKILADAAGKGGYLLAENQSDPISLNVAFDLLSQLKKIIHSTNLSSKFSDNDKKLMEANLRILQTYIQTLLELGGGLLANTTAPLKLRDPHFPTQRLYPLEVVCSDRTTCDFEVLELLFKNDAAVFSRSDPSYAIPPYSLIDRLLALEHHPLMGIEMKHFQDYFDRDQRLLQGKELSEHNQLKKNLSYIISQMIRQWENERRERNAQLSQLFTHDNGLALPKGILGEIDEFGTDYAVEDISYLFEKDFSAFDKLQDRLLSLFREAHKAFNNDMNVSIETTAFYYRFTQTKDRSLKARENTSERTLESKSAP